MKVVTAGSAFIDIDAYGGMFAEAELQRHLGFEAQAVTSAPINESVTETVRSWGGDVQTTYAPNPDDTFTLVDVSDPTFFDPIVDLERIEAVVDHHSGFEEYWQKRIGAGAQIEFIGAACTLVYERWVASERLKDMSATSARVLMTGILDNTLNFKAGVTTDRDHVAYEALMKLADLPEDWPVTYFTECQRAMEADLAKTIKNDYKTLPPSDVLPEVMAQLVLWDGGKDSFLGSRKAELLAVLNKITSAWWVNIISLSDGSSYFMAANQTEEDKLSRLMNVSFKNSVAKADRLYMRKEILKAAQKAAS